MGIDYRVAVVFGIRYTRTDEDFESDLQERVEKAGLEIFAEGVCDTPECVIGSSVFDLEPRKYAWRIDAFEVPSTYELELCKRKLTELGFDTGGFGFWTVCYAT